MHPRTLIEWARRGAVPAELSAYMQEVQHESAWYQARIEAPGTVVYGANTLTGHLDATRIDAAEMASLQGAIIESHCIGEPPMLDPESARLCGYAKALSITRGGTGISGELYGHLLASLADEDFQPAVPALASYSCGDVIPGAHWARALLRHAGFERRYELRPGEALGLINGNFIDLGTTTALLPRLADCLVAMCINLRLAATAFGQHEAELLARPAGLPVQSILEFIAGGAGRADARERQLPVSLRAAPDLVATLVNTAGEVRVALATELEQRSANPLVRPREGDVLSQASFMSLALSVRKSALLDALQLAMWTSVRRITHLAAEKAEQSKGIDKLSLVQAPKLAQALLEKSRLECGRRPFASGGSTSEGVEDLWSMGLLLTHQLRALLENWDRLLRIERGLYEPGIDGGDECSWASQLRKLMDLD